MPTVVIINTGTSGGVWCTWTHKCTVRTYPWGCSDDTLSFKNTDSHFSLCRFEGKHVGTVVEFSPWTWLISELEDRISSASFWAVGSTSVWWAVIKYWTSFCSWSLFIWNNVSEMGSRSFTCSNTGTETCFWFVHNVFFTLPFPSLCPCCLSFNYLDIIERFCPLVWGQRGFSLPAVFVNKEFHERVKTRGQISLSV